MAKALLICYREPPSEPLTDRQLEHLAARLLPDNIGARPPLIVRSDRVVTVVLNPGSGAVVDNGSVRIGVLGANAGDWAAPEAPAPRGDYALFRVASDRIELVADAAATRSIWYACTDELFVASTSQRAIVAALGSFEPNRAACAWLLSAGNLGPRHGWDRRLERIPPAGRVLLRRDGWILETVEPTIEIAAPTADVDPNERRRALEAAIDGVVRTLDIDYSKWIVPLSGGVDSRGVLLALLRATPEGTPLECVTWGRASAPHEPGNDAYVARALAERLGVEHDFFAVEPSSEPRERLLHRFLTAGEGRVDAIGGYLDGFAVWKALYERGVEGVIRGDEAFGWKPVRTDRDVRESLHLTTLADVLPSRDVAELELPAQRLEAPLERRGNETLAAWRDRLYQQFRLPVVLAALTDLKLSYVEVSNPLLDSDVLTLARSLPDELRTDKRLWRELVDEWSPDIPYARHAAVTSLRTFMLDREMLALVLDELASRSAAALAAPHAVASLRATVEAQLKRPDTNIRASAPRFGTRIVRRVRRRATKKLLGRLELHPLVLAFRMTIASRMCAMLHEDSCCLRDAIG